MKSVSTSSQRGSALITVLWAVVILSLIAASFTTAMRREAGAGVHAVQQAQLRHLAQAAANLVVRELDIPEEERGFDPDGQWFTVPVGDRQIAVSVIDESGRLDINRGSVQILVRLLLQLGLDEARAESLAAAIDDWRSGRPGHSEGAPNESAYEGSGLGPRGNRYFLSVDEVQRVLGMEPWIYRRIQHLLTIYTGAEIPDPTWASAEILAAFPGMEPDSAQSWIEERDFNRAQGAEVPPFPGGAVGGGGMGLGVYTVRAVARDGEAAAYFEQTVTMNATPTQAWQLLEFRHAPPGAAGWQAP